MRFEAHVTGCPILPDPFGVGQQSVARIQREVSAALLLDCAESILTTRYVPDLCMSGRIDTYHHARRAYNDALAVMGGAF